MKYDERELLIIWLDSFKDINYESKRKIFDILVGKSDLKKNIESNRQSILAMVGDAGVNALLSSANGEY